MRGKRVLNSMRVRRRQSDAKWRASVASCYDTLKFVIPENGKLPKRKISKAVILQETDRHIKDLENAISNLLTHEADSLNKSILWRTGKQWSNATLSHIRKEFEGKQAQLFEQSTQGRRKYSMLSDIEDEILNMAADTSKLTVITQDRTSKTVSNIHSKATNVNRSRILRKELTKPCTATSSPCSKKARKNSYSGLLTSQDSKNHLPVICERLPSSIFNNTLPVNHESRPSLDAMPSFNTPSKMLYTIDSDRLFSPIPESDEFSTPIYCPPRRPDNKPIITSPSVTKIAKQLDFTIEETSTPIRPSCAQDRMKEMCNIFGFTPIKLPASDQTMTPMKQVSLQAKEGTPNLPSPHKTLSAAYPPQTPKSNDGVTDDEETRSLLCFETFDMPEDAPDWEKTPNKKTEKRNIIMNEISDREDRKSCKKKMAFAEGRRNRRNEGRTPKCRKNLEKIYASSSEVPETLPVITGVFNKDSNCSDFDGYFLFYRQVVEELHQHMSRQEIASPSVAVLVSQMWSDMSSADKETMATLAALEGSQDSNSNSSLSNDLQELDVKPLDQSHFLDAERLGLFRNDLQTVPTADAKMVHATVNKVLHRHDVQEVPVSQHTEFSSQNRMSEDTAVFSMEFEDMGSDFQVTDISLSSDYTEAISSQIVPDISHIVKRDVLLSSSQSSVIH